MPRRRERILGFDRLTGIEIAERVARIVEDLRAELARIEDVRN